MKKIFNLTSLFITLIVANIGVLIYICSVPSRIDDSHNYSDYNFTLNEKNDALLLSNKKK